MTTRRLIFCLVTCACALFLVGRVAVSLFPLRAHAQELNSSPIQVVAGGDNLVHRAALVYPRRAIERRVEGEVALEVSVDEQGQVSDARVLSGPEELRRPCLQSVLEWRYRIPTSATTQVMVHFQLPKQGSSSEVVLPAAPEESEGVAVRYFVMSNPQGAAAAERKMKELEEKMQSPGVTAQDRANYELSLAKLKAQLAEDGGSPETQVIDPEQLEREVRELKAKIADAGTSPEVTIKLKKELEERLADMARVQEGDAGYFVLGSKLPGGDFVLADGPIKGKLITIRTERVPQASLDALTPILGVHVGDAINEDVARQVRETVHQSLGAEYRALFRPNGEGGVELVIVGP